MATRIHVAGISEWNDEDVGAAFEVTGIVVEVQCDTAPNTDNDSSMPGPGKRYVIENPVLQRI
ncbi:hypothetical protein D5S18_29835 [Nocardia panacis]|uniref:Uncharacterized protein n=2 Tax=Nocardia panacis TaxID=2340916 RepID=A0A3A4KBQ2_9NOCA|nr:hypothetical protein D5S18_29835 [Nocardia panacis]